MHFSLTEEQAAIQETALTFAKERMAPFASEWDEKSHFPVDVIRETAALGMATIYVPAEQGGSGLSRLDGALIMEALAYGCPAISGYISIHNMVAWMVGKYGSQTQVDEWMPKLASMDWLTSYCLTEPGAGSDAAALETSAKRSGDTYVLNGTKQFISGAGDELLGAVEHIGVAGALGRGLKRGGIGAGTGLGEAVARQPLHRGELRHPLLDLRLRAVFA